MEIWTSKVVTLSFSTPSGAILVTRAGEGAVGEALDLDAGGLAEVDLADVGLVDLAFDVDLVGVAEGHDEGGGGAEDEDGADGVADLDVAGEDDAVDGRGDGGVGELLFELLEGGLGLLDLGFGSGGAWRCRRRSGRRPCRGCWRRRGTSAGRRPWPAGRATPSFCISRARW